MGCAVEDTLLKTTQECKNFHPMTAEIVVIKMIVVQALVYALLGRGVAIYKTNVKRILPLVRLEMVGDRFCVT